MSDEVSMTTDEALIFLRDVLGMETTKDQIHNNRIAFLDELTMAWIHHIPFQSIRAISVPHPERHLPSFAEIKKDLFSKIGGLCYDHSLSTLAVLRALGFDVSLVTCDVSFQDSHALVLVHNASSQGSIHMVDVGTGYPTFKAIPFDFELVSPEYHHSYLRYRFIREGDLIIRQHHADTDPRASLWPDRVKDGWYSFIYIHYDKPQKISYFDRVMTTLYTEKLSTPPYLTSPRCMTWPKGRFICIKDTTLLVEKEEGRVEKSYLKSLDDIVAAYKNYFPQFPEDIVKAAMNDAWVDLDFSKILPATGHA
ncbi:uncharacterized protein LOC100893633 [Strongylocentrotus purpuratus]|uniref:arylamine N-acetyltransferase n=1 Tax=Strongylocentrotus purpuratus TaxID=7668 RepID=A0A7M7GGW0_STRPU|nr:uncharacterized protein LOC100893633 [Strongylocentrotus purpuratus]|eukprot:XP_003728158.1 PREDICTED: uncharacterized protein LOC100893633 [Strongylocentrotus purpuratus]